MKDVANWLRSWLVCAVVGHAWRGVYVHLLDGTMVSDGKWQCVECGKEVSGRDET